MKKIITICFLWIQTLYITHSQIAIDTKRKISFPPVLCYGLPVDANRVEPLPEEVKTRLKSGQKTATVEVTYVGFTATAKTAFQYAIDIWATMISSPVPIRIEARWEPLGTGVLGSASPDNFYLGSEESPKRYRYYPTPLAEKILGRDINGESSPDIIARFSSNQAWSFKTDGVPVSGKYDLVSVVLHEFCHGIGFIGGFSVNSNGVGSYGIVDDQYFPIFDQYLQPLSESVYVIDTLSYPDNSTALGKVLTSGSVYFNSFLAKRVNGNNRPQLYSPLKWNQGSSIYHLDETKYHNTSNELMTPFTQTAEVIYNPGSLARSIMYEMGWWHTWIKHDTLPDIEKTGVPVTIKAVITSDTALSKNSMKLFYSMNNFTDVSSLPLLPTGKPNEFAAQIIPVSLDKTISYYILAKDTFQRVYTSPSEAPEFFHSFYVGADTKLPEIDHQAIPYVLNTVYFVDVKANVRDNLGLDSVYVEYKVNGMDKAPFPLLLGKFPEYKGKFDFLNNPVSIGDEIQYRIVAVDSSAAKNTRYHPVSGYHGFLIEEVPSAVNEYQNDFNSPTHDFLMNGFFITQPAGFNSLGLHSLHPYPSPDMDLREFNFDVQLRVPIIIRNTEAYLKFSEVALVEPGEPNSVFGSDDFYDYVVVEGSKDGGTSWEKFESGWDCRAWIHWNDTYNSSFDVKNNSTALGNESQYKTRLINLLGNSYFQGGDTVLIRFRLYSDPYAHGWGWAIDNLYIQGQVSSTEDYAYKTNFELFPNPTSGPFRIRFPLNQELSSVTITIIDITGTEVFRQNFEASGRVFDRWIEPGLLNSGAYLVKIQTGEAIVLHKLILSNR